MELGIKINDKTMLKYGTYIYKKASEIVQSIENQEEIDNSKIDSYISQFSGYLSKLTSLSYENTELPITIPTSPDNTQNTGTQTNSGIQDINRETTQT